MSEDTTAESSKRSISDTDPSTINAAGLGDNYNVIDNKITALPTTSITINSCSESASPIDSADATSWKRVKFEMNSDSSSTFRPVSEEEIQLLEKTLRDQKQKLAEAVSKEKYEDAAFLKKSITELEATIANMKESLREARKNALLNSEFPDASVLASTLVANHKIYLASKWLDIKPHIKIVMAQIGVFLTFLTTYRQPANFVAFRYIEKVGFQVFFDFGCLLSFQTDGIKRSNSGDRNSKISKYNDILQYFSIDNITLKSLHYVFGRRDLN
jgi:hypothetical protein